MFQDSFTDNLVVELVQFFFFFKFGECVILLFVDSGKIPRRKKIKGNIDQSLSGQGLKHKNGHL